ncbi:MAG: hypothetical protein JXB32_22350 [Deltaproteobacteria bacterium]|nr:hypothetical protein [Deltaproteobacteria bacterium]
MLALAACSTGGSTNPCDGVACSNRGFCLAEGDRPYCACIPGYHPVGTTCIPNDPGDPCGGIDCSGHGTCRTVGDEPTCDCDDGWRHLGGEGCSSASCDLVCVEDEATDGGGDRAADDAAADDPGTAEDSLPEVVEDAGPGVEHCANGVDDDGDGATDCADATCDGQDCGTNRVCRGGACVCRGSGENCTNGRDDDCDGAVDCEDDDCDGRVCADDGTYCGAELRCHVCRGGACVVDDPHYDASCAPSCGAAQGLCGRPTFCCAVGSACAGGAADGAYGCGVCCFDGCCDASETSCDDGVDNDCDGATDCGDGECVELSCGGGGACRGGVCCYPADPCAGCECGTRYDSCGNGYTCGYCGGSPCMDECECY